MLDADTLGQARLYALKRLERELSPGLLYHGLAHSRDDVVPAAERLADGEGIRGEALYLLLTAAWFHDLGFIEQRADHEMASARLAAEILPSLGYGAAQIQTIQGIVLATVVPQAPATILENIMADADLDVLGREDFMRRNDHLRRELAFFGQEFTDAEWWAGQLQFVLSHTYFTASACALRDAGKLRNIAALQQLLTRL